MTAETLPPPASHAPTHPGDADGAARDGHATPPGVPVPASTHELLLRTPEAAERIGVSQRTVLAWAQKGWLPSLTTPGGHRRYRARDVDAHAAGGPLLTPAEVAARFRVSPKTVGRWLASGRLDGYETAGGHRRAYAADVERLLSQDGDPR